MTDFSDAIKQIQENRGISRELVLKTIEEFLLAAYKKKYGTSDNALVRFNDDMSNVAIYAKKQIVTLDDYYDPVIEIPIEEALAYNEDCEVGDELLIEINPREFDRSAIQSAKQKAWQNLKEIQKDTLYSEFKDKEGEMIIGYYQREKNGNIFVDLGKTEGMLPKKYQSPREEYHMGDRIKAYIYEVKKTDTGLQIHLSRTHTDFVKKIFELEVPEIYDKTVEIYKIVREPGYRTKLAVMSNRDDVDPVGACVGMKGIRIQAIVKELEGEKIDILKFDPDPSVFIRNALSPADVQDVVILDSTKKHALAIVSEQQLSLAIGKQGLNVRLANRLVDWNIDVKTEQQFREMDISEDLKKAASSLFRTEDDSEEITRIAELPDIPLRIVEVLRQNGIELIENLFNIELKELAGLHGITEDDVSVIRKIIDDNVLIEESEQDSRDYDNEDVTDEESDDTYECPECGAPITSDMATCSQCGVGLSFEIEEIEQEEQE
jgi:N utilization substance protein A